MIFASNSFRRRILQTRFHRTRAQQDFQTRKGVGGYRDLGGAHPEGTESEQSRRNHFAEEFTTGAQPRMARRSYWKVTRAAGDIMSDMAVSKQNRQRNSAASASPARKARSPRLQGQKLRRALEELRDTKSETRAQELKRAISDSICGA
jgi:hypothetical protein